MCIFCLGSDGFYIFYSLAIFFIWKFSFNYHLVNPFIIFNALFPIFPFFFLVHLMFAFFHLEKIPRRVLNSLLGIPGSFLYPQSGYSIPSQAVGRRFFFKNPANYQYCTLFPVSGILLAFSNIIMKRKITFQHSLRDFYFDKEASELDC